MKTAQNNFNTILTSIYDLPLEEKEELKILLEHNISDARRKEIESSYKNALKEQSSGKLEFSSSVKKLKKML